jgi:hypothetical protein
MWCSITLQGGAGKLMDQSGEPNNWAETAGLGKALASLPNADLLTALDVVLLELEKRLMHYAQVGGEMLAMADEGLVLAARSGARLKQAQSAASHTAGHLQVVGVGEWSPRSTNPSWADDPRVAGNDA